MTFMPQGAFGKNNFAPFNDVTPPGSQPVLFSPVVDGRGQYITPLSPVVPGVIPGTGSAERFAYSQNSLPRLPDYQLDRATAVDTGVEVAMPLDSAAGRSRQSKPGSLEEWNWWTTVWTAVVFLLCPACIWCTLGALICNIFAYVDHQTGDHERRQSKQRCAIGWSVAAFILGLLTLLIVIIVLYTALGAQDWIILPAPPDYDYAA